MDVTKAEWLIVSKSFARALCRVRLLWQAGLVVRTLLLGAGLVGIVLIGYALIDRVFALSTQARMAASIGFVLVLMLYVLFQLFRVARMRGRDAAVWADRRLVNRRRLVFGAWELGQMHGGGSAFQHYLVECSRERAAAAIQKLSSWSCVPWSAIRRSACVLGLAVLVMLAAWGLFPESMGILLARIIHPQADIPPVSRIDFVVTPQQPEVIYGDDVELVAALEGHSSDETVWLLTRGRNGIQRRACFRESDKIFVQRLENVIEPVEFCFRTRKARSHWYPVRLRLQPRIASAHVAIHPPKYTRRAVRRFYVGDEPVTALRNARVELEVKSNRPLGSGVVVICGDDKGDEASIEGELVGTSGMRFSWDVQRSADISIRIVDAIGTPSAGQHGFRQVLQKDEPPQAAITEPGAFTLVTPEVSVSIDGVAEDDIGLRGVNVVRSLVGYRDRVLPLSLPSGQRMHELALPLDLKLLGLRPGNTLEFYLEAADSNPSMGGVAVSDVSRLQVISRAEYAAMLRMKTTVREFNARYQALSHQLQELRDVLRDLAESSDALDEETRRAAMEKAREVGTRASDLFERMAADFPIFDMEQRLPSILAELRGVNQRYSEQMAGLSSPYEQAGRIASRWLKELEPGAGALTQEIKDAETISKVAGVVSSAIGIRRAIEKQKQLVRRLNRYEVNADVRQLKGFLAKLRLQQNAIREDLEKVIERLDLQVQDLPASQKYLADDIIEFLEKFRGSGVLGHMDGASNSALNGDAHETYRQAKLALEALLELLDECDKEGNCFTSLCRNAEQGKGLQMGEGLQSTMQQMCDALSAMLGMGPYGMGPSGAGGGGGGSIGGDPENGYWSNQSTLLNVPVIGPKRTRFQPQRGSGRGEDGSGAGQGSVGASAQRERLSQTEFDSTESVDVQPHRVPEQYRDAVKRFYEK